MKVRINENLFKLACNIEIVTALSEYNCFDYCFPILFVNVTGWILLYHVLLWILTRLSALNISVDITHPEIYDSQGLNEKLKFFDL